MDIDELWRMTIEIMTRKEEDQEEKKKKKQEALRKAFEVYKNYKEGEKRVRDHLVGTLEEYGQW